MAICGTPDCSEQSVGYYKNQRTEKMAQMCAYCRARKDNTGPRLKPGKLPIKNNSLSAKWQLSGSLNIYDWSSEEPFFDTVLHGSDGNLETIWNGRNAHHRTQPHTNLTVVYTRMNNDIVIIGIGNHTGNGNKKYSICFDDGQTRRCERK
ncbi:hypothetical protein [Agaribacterium sp. ZY112]|uniref:hypothetical protein n=1 Tax=Agaribacterium sp. ZY112 TaxID=3233574 RepID=UPI003523C32B